MGSVVVLQGSAAPQHVGYSWIRYSMDSMESMSPALTGGSLITGLPGKPPSALLVPSSMASFSQTVLPSLTSYLPLLDLLFTVS